jgi:hypothetical protein
LGAEGRGFTAGCEEGWCRKVLKFDRPFAGGFLGLTALRAEGCGGALRAISIYAAKGGRIVSLTLRNTILFSEACRLIA